MLYDPHDHFPYCHYGNSKTTLFYINKLLPRLILNLTIANRIISNNYLNK